MIPGHLEHEYVALLDLYRKRVRHGGTELPLCTLVLDEDGLRTYRARERSTSEKAQKQHCCIARHLHDILLRLGSNRRSVSVALVSPRAASGAYWTTGPDVGFHTSIGAIRPLSSCFRI